MEMYSSDKLLLVLRQQQMRYALPAENVEEVITSPSVTVLPRQPEYLKGILNYKGHMIPVLSLQALCGSGEQGNETVCVILRMEDGLYGLLADNAETIVTDSGERIKYDDSFLQGGILAFERVLPGETAIFVLDLSKTLEAVENRIN